MSREISRRGKAARWLANLSPLLEVITRKATGLGLGDARMFSELMVGKRFVDQAGDRIRRGAVWHVDGRNCGFHVDFCAKGMIHIEAWTGGERKVSAWISGAVTEMTLKRDLTVCLVAAGLTDLARTEEVRDQLFSRTATK